MAAAVLDQLSEATAWFLRARRVNLSVRHPRPGTGGEGPGGRRAGYWMTFTKVPSTVYCT